MKQQPIPHPVKAGRECGFAIAVPSAGAVNVKVHGSGSAYPDDTEGAKEVAAAQFSKPNSLCLDVGFGESRSVALTFDDYGRQSAFEWSSNATAVASTGAIAGLVSSATELRSSLQGPGLIQSQEAEIKRLETQQKLNELRKCQAIIEAGGYECTPTKE